MFLINVCYKLWEITSVKDLEIQVLPGCSSVVERLHVQGPGVHTHTHTHEQQVPFSKQLESSLLSYLLLRTSTVAQCTQHNILGLMEPMTGVLGRQHVCYPTPPSQAVSRFSFQIHWPECTLPPHSPVPVLNAQDSFLSHKQEALISPWRLGSKDW
jgi:hypothetical protein